MQLKSLTVGMDEAGRGPLAGPVVAAAVVLKPRYRLSGLNDSKVLSQAKREHLFERIHKHAIAVGIAVVDHIRIDEINILQASLEAMRLAFHDAQSKCDQLIQIALIDGNQRANIAPHVEERTIVDGDAIEPVIMAASIIAKVHRDRMMCDFATIYPGYGFENHKGYSTRAHRDALQSLGPCAIHRRSFAPVSRS